MLQVRASNARRLTTNAWCVWVLEKQQHYKTRSCIDAYQYTSPTGCTNRLTIQLCIALVAPSLCTGHSLAAWVVLRPIYAMGGFLRGLSLPLCRVNHKGMSLNLRHPHAHNLASL